MATEPDKVDTSVLGTLIAVLGFGVLATALAITALVRTQEDEIQAERSETSDEFAALRGAQEADLHLPAAYIDQKAGTVRLPIDRAMEVVVRDLRRNPESATARAKNAQENGHGTATGAAASDTLEGAGIEPGDKREGDQGLDVRQQPDKPTAPNAPRAPQKPEPAKAPAPPSSPGVAPPSKAPPQPPPPAPAPPVVPAQPQ